MPHAVAVPVVLVLSGAVAPTEHGTSDADASDAAPDTHAEALGGSVSVGTPMAEGAHGALGAEDESEVGNRAEYSEGASLVSVVAAYVAPAEGSEVRTEEYSGEDTEVMEVSASYSAAYRVTREGGTVYDVDYPGVEVSYVGDGVSGPSEASTKGSPDVSRLAGNRRVKVADGDVGASQSVVDDAEAPARDAADAPVVDAVGPDAPLIESKGRSDSVADARRGPTCKLRQAYAGASQPRAESREPRAESREPRAGSQEPRAEGREPSG